MIYTYIIEAHRVMDDNTTNEVGETARVPIIFPDYFLLIQSEQTTQSNIQPFFQPSTKLRNPRGQSERKTKI